MMVVYSRKHHCRVRPYTREVLVFSTNVEIQTNHYPLNFRNRSRRLVLDILKKDKIKVKTEKTEHEMEKRKKSKSTKLRALYTKSCACSKGGFADKFVRDPNKIPDSSQRPPHDCPKCGNPVDGLYCRHCALLRKKLKEVWFTICDEHKFFQDFLNTFESSNDDSNVVNAPQEPIVFNQDPCKNSSQSPPHIDHYCCYGCGDSLDVSIISNPEPCPNQNIDEFPQTLPSFHPTCYSGDENSFTYDLTLDFVNDSSNVFNPPSQPLMYSYEFCGNNAQYGHDCLPQKSPICYDDDEESSTPLRDIIISELPPYIAITSILSTKETKGSLIMGDKYLDTIPKKESDEFIKSSVENLVSNPSESEDECEYDVPICEDFTTLSNLLFDTDEDFSSSDNESFSNMDIPKKIYLNPIFDEEIISIKIDMHQFNAESDLIKSLLNQDSSIISSSKIDYLLDEFAGELILLKLIPPGIDEADCDPEEEIPLIEKL
uniref:Uncharacterized protein n=1 Tax=Tanacetum cinerariifolium TaxID=118510 RepID=A0A699HKE4_TANCI|nr:hypothetical protein [Tanacetum cinerariifolium]